MILPSSLDMYREQGLSTNELWGSWGDRMTDFLLAETSEAKSLNSIAQHVTQARQASSLEQQSHHIEK